MRIVLWVCANQQAARGTRRKPDHVRDLAAANDAAVQRFVRDERQARVADSEDDRSDRPQKPRQPARRDGQDRGRVNREPHRHEQQP